MARYPAPHRATIKQRLRDLQDVQAGLRELDEDEPDIIARSMARYVTVRAVGYVEAVRDDLADLYAYNTGHASLHRRIAYHLRTGLGATPEQLLTFVGSFNPDWRIQLEAALDADDQRLRNQLGAMVAARKKVAHGDGDQVTTGKALQWADAAQEIVAQLEELFDPA